MQRQKTVARNVQKRDEILDRFKSQNMLNIMPSKNVNPLKPL